MKDYKRILQGVVNIINITKKSDIGFANICTYIGENCPELAESEDEKIIQFLIQEVKETSDEIMSYRGMNKEAVLAWLEKQQKPIKEHDVCDFCDEKHGCVSPCPTKLIEEQKTGDFSDLRTWKYIVDAVRTEKEGIGQYLDSPFTEEVAKKLQKRFGKIEQKPAEWSEEDEDTIKFLISHFCVSQSQWRPSEEQMNTLEQWLKDNQYKGDARYCYPIFESLYQDLQKLKG